MSKGFEAIGHVVSSTITRDDRHCHQLNESSSAYNPGTKFAPLCRLIYRPHGIEIFRDLASLLEVFGNAL